MSITIADILRLPAMSGAKIVAGRNGLDRAVEVVSVLEYCNISDELEQFFDNNAFEGNVLLLTAFSDIRNNVDAQCENIHRYYSAGASGIVLYYVGTILSNIDPHLVDICNSLDFPLICMPEGTLNLQYSEAISEIMFEIFRNQQREHYFVGNLLDRVSKLPPHQRKMETLLRMLSDHLHISVILRNPITRDSTSAYWPRVLSEEVERQLDVWLQDMKRETQIEVPLGEGHAVLHRSPRVFYDDCDCDIYLLKYGEALSEDILWQTSELIRLFIHIWNQDHGKFVTSEIVHAIINDAPAQMNRLSALFHINVEDLNQMWLFHPKTGERHYDESFVRQVSDHLETFSKPVIVSYYEENLVVFAHAPLQYEERQEICVGIKALTDLTDYDVICWNCIADTTAARVAYLDSIQYLPAAKKIYPGKKILSESDILFTKQCVSLSKDSASVKQYLRILAQLQGENSVFLSTAEIYLLDASSNMLQTAKKMFVHLNTIKYRLRMIQNLLGYSPGKMPDAYPLYVAVSLHRLMEQ